MPATRTIKARTERAVDTMLATMTSDEIAALTDDEIAAIAAQVADAS